MYVYYLKVNACETLHPQMTIVKTDGKLFTEVNYTLTSVKQTKQKQYPLTRICYDSGRF